MNTLKLTLTLTPKVEKLIMKKMKKMMRDTLEAKEFNALNSEKGGSLTFYSHIHPKLSTPKKFIKIKY